MNTTPLSLATLENAFFKNLHNQPAAEELHLIHHKSGPPSPDGARSKAFFPAGAGQNLPLRRVRILSVFMFYDLSDGNHTGLSPLSFIFLFLWTCRTRFCCRIEGVNAV